MRDGCPFCAYDGPSEIIERYLYSGCFVIEPINPVTEGHVLVIPEAHIESVVAATTAFERLAVADAFRCAISYAQERLAGDFNLITSVGEAATQTVKHLHVHVVPRRKDDGLLLPWSETKSDRQPMCPYCGLLGWTVRDYGRVTHKQMCPHRTDPWHQGDPGATA